MVLSTAARNIKARSKKSGRVVVRGGRVVSGRTFTIKQKINQARAAVLSQQMNIQTAPLKNLILLARSLGVPFDPKASRKVLEKNIQAKSSSVLSTKRTAKPEVQTIDISKVKVEGDKPGPKRAAPKRDIVISQTRAPFKDPVETRVSKKDILRQQLTISGAEAGLRAIKVGKRKQLFQRVTDRLVNDIEKRRQESISVSRAIAAKERQGKSLTARESAAKIAAGAQNIGIEFIAGLTALPVLISRPVRTTNALKRAVTNPSETLRSIGSEIRRNPSGFIAGWVGAGQGFSQLGKLARFTVKTTGKTLKYSIKGSLAAADGTIKITKAGAQGTLKLFNKAGRKIVEKARSFKIGKGAKVAKKAAKVTKVKDLAKRVDSITRSVSSLKKAIKGKPNIPKQLLKQIKRLEVKRAALIKKIGKSPKALTEEGIKKAQIEALRLKKLLEKRLFKKEDLLRRKGIKKAIKQKRISKAEKIRRRREKAAQIKQSGKTGRKRSRDPFRKRELKNEIQRLRQQAKPQRGQQTFKDVAKTTNAANKIDNLRTAATISNLKFQSNVRNFFKNMNTKVGRRFKSGNLKGCK